MVARIGKTLSFLTRIAAWNSYGKTNVGNPTSFIHIHEDQMIGDMRIIIYLDTRNLLSFNNDHC